MTLPGRRIEVGGLHPICEPLAHGQFWVNGVGASRSEIEDDYHNDLNIPSHPALLCDTFYIDDARAAYCTGVGGNDGITEPPIRVICQASHCRDSNDAFTDVSSVEGLLIDQTSTFGHLKPPKTSYDL